MNHLLSLRSSCSLFPFLFVFASFRRYFATGVIFWFELKKTVSVFVSRTFCRESLRPAPDFRYFSSFCFSCLPNILLVFDYFWILIQYSKNIFCFWFDTISDIFILLWAFLLRFCNIRVQKKVCKKIRGTASTRLFCTCFRSNIQKHPTTALSYSSNNMVPSSIYHIKRPAQHSASSPRSIKAHVVAAARQRKEVTYE